MSNSFITAVSAITTVIAFYNDEVALSLLAFFFLCVSLLGSCKWAFDNSDQKKEHSFRKNECSKVNHISNIDSRLIIDGKHAKCN